MSNKKIFDWSPEIPDEQTSLWRYLNFEGFVCLLEKEALWLSSADRLGDKFEGSLPVEEYLEWHKTVKEELSNTVKKYYLDNLKKLFQKTTFINCWHINDKESVAMWEQYATQKSGLAIKTTVENLKNSMLEVEIVDQENVAKSAHYDSKLAMGKVEYIDYTNDHLPSDSLIAPFFYKRSSYKHEAEFRIVDINLNRSDNIFNKDPKNFLNCDEFEKGKYLLINPKVLINEIIISPRAPSWFKEVVIATAEKWNISGQKISQSDLDTDPLF